MEDRAILFAIQGLEAYAPLNESYSKVALEQLEAELTQAEQAEARLRQAYEAARDHAIAIGRRFHTTMGTAKVQVLAQFGDDSTAVSAIGLKKRSERKRPARRATTSTD